MGAKQQQRKSWEGTKKKSLRHRGIKQQQYTSLISLKELLEELELSERRRLYPSCWVSVFRRRCYPFQSPLSLDCASTHLLSCSFFFVGILSWNLVLLVPRHRYQQSWQIVFQVVLKLPCARPEKINISQSHYAVIRQVWECNDSPFWRWNAIRFSSSHPSQYSMDLRSPSPVSLVSKRSARWK